MRLWPSIKSRRGFELTGSRDRPSRFVVSSVLGRAGVYRCDILDIMRNPYPCRTVVSTMLWHSSHLYTEVRLWIPHEKEVVLKRNSRISQNNVNHVVRPSLWVARRSRQQGYRLPIFRLKSRGRMYNLKQERDTGIFRRILVLFPNDNLSTSSSAPERGQRVYTIAETTVGLPCECD
jgi:hypothetical protein